MITSPSKPRMNFKNRTLYHCDNLDVMRGMNSETVDLIATDPPFNKGRDFHATPDSLASGAKFEDRWSWDKDVHNDWVDQIKDDWPAVWQVIQAARLASGDDMAAFLCWLGVRVMEMHRLLKDTGSLYLHCDPTASHYLKAVLDAIFGRRNFQNEIIWTYRTGGASRRAFGRKHDVLLRYTKARDWIFNVQKERSYLSGQMGHRKSDKVLIDEHGAYQEIIFSKTEIKLYKDQRGYYTMVNCRDYWPIDAIGRSSAERSGYPTQKPIELYERIIKASSNEGDIIFDPFAGCATTLIASERQLRGWVGVDIWDGAFDEIQRRMQDARQLLRETAPQIHYETKPPMRTDANEIAAPTLKLRTQRPTEPWQKIPHKHMVNALAVAQSSATGIVCAGCGRVLEIEFMELDHITPKSDRGTNDIQNRILLCRPCNGKKRDNLTLRGLVRANGKSGWMRDADLTKQARTTAERVASWIRDEFDSDDCSDLLQADSGKLRTAMGKRLRHILYTL